MPVEVVEKSGLDTHLIFRLMNGNRRQISNNEDGLNTIVLNIFQSSCLAPSVKF